MEISNSYIKDLFIPRPTKNTINRNVKAVNVNLLCQIAVAGNVEGSLSISPEAIGMPYEAAENRDGTIKFSKSGKIVIRVNKEIVNLGTMMHNNYVAGLQAWVDSVHAEKKEACEAMVAASIKAAQPLVSASELKIAAALKAYAEAEAKKAEAEAEEAAKDTADIPDKELVPVA